ncbi:MAG: hypothetical protein PF569_00195 [Candidatus Woesearchaeota archaeon]|jgi:hypothetical protein|nr:hypothetical protein [Candidatus Woesearchaeota archaeon]
MIKQELEDIIEQSFQEFERGNLSPQEKISIVEKIIINGRNYLNKYKTPYKHPFMNDKIKITENLLDNMQNT